MKLFYKSERKCFGRKLAVIVMLVALALFTGCATAETTVETQTDDFYVNDFANLFSEEQKSEMMERATDLDENYDGTQVVVTTIESLNGMTMEKYANTMYNQYGIGQDSKGTLIILSTEDREVRIEVGNGLEGYLTDSVSGRILDDYGMDYFKDDDFATGLVNVQEAVVNYIIENVPEEALFTSTLDVTETESMSNEEVVADSDSTNDDTIMIFFVLAFAGLIFFFVAFLVVTKKLEKLSKKYDELMFSANSNSCALKELEKLNTEKVKKLKENESTISSLRSDLEKNLEALSQQSLERLKLIDWRNLAIILYPNLDEEVRLLKEKNDKVAAEKAFEQMKAIADGKMGRHEDCDDLRRAYEIYQKLTSDEKQYFPDAKWLEEFQSKFDEAEQDEKEYQSAKKAESLVHCVIDDIGSPDEGDVDDLNDAMNYYNGLSSAERAYFNVALLEQLKHMQRVAEDDYEMQERRRRREAEERRRREEAEERRRREERARYSSSSSSHSGGSFGGHGGHSSGGGAGRSF